MRLQTFPSLLLGLQSGAAASCRHSQVGSLGCNVLLLLLRARVARGSGSSGRCWLLWLSTWSPLAVLSSQI